MTNFNFLLNNLSYLSSEDLVGRPMDSTCFRSASVPPSFRLRLHPLRMVATLLLILCLGVGNVWGETATLTISEYASANSWSNSSKYSTAVVSPITFTGSGGTNSTKYFSSDDTWRFYSSDSPAGKITITTTSAYKITAISSSPTKTWTKKSDTEWYHQVSSNTNFTSITVTYSSATPATAHTVTFYKTDGSTQVITEASVGAGVTPPVMSTPCDGWAFQGWSKSQSTSSTSTTVLTTETLTAGKYYPSANTTLYPAYTKAGTASTDLTIVPGSFSSKGSNNYGSGAERTASVDGISFGAHYITGNAANNPASGKTAGTYLQCKASDANIYNKSAFPGSITKVVINQYAAQAFSLYCGSSQLMASNNTSTGQTPSGTAQSAQTAATQMTWNVSAASKYTYFDLKKGPTASYVSSIVVTYLAPVTYYYSYPSCCTELGSINGSVLWSNGTLLGGGRFSRSVGRTLRVD